MITAALSLEFRNLMRSPLRLLTLVLVLSVGYFVIAQGQKDVSRWQESIDKGIEAQNESLEEARSYFAQGVPGPADRPWVDLRQNRYQDYYASVRLARDPAPLAGMAFASAESGAVTMRMYRFADPMLAQGNKIENPALAAAGGLDLVTVLTLLIPLLILALGVEVGGYERSTGLLPLVRVQTGRDRSWIWARCLAVGLIAAAAGLTLAAIAVTAAGAGLSDALPLCALIIAYVAVWTALLAVIALRARNPSHGAVGLGTAWIVLCVLIPSLGVERSAALAAGDFALDLTVEAREEKGLVYEKEQEELYAAVSERFPALIGKEPEPRSAGVNAVREGLRLINLEERMAEREEHSQSHATLVKWMNLASPTLAFSHALEGLAGRGPEVAQAFRQAMVDGLAKRAELSIAANWRMEPLGLKDFEDLVAASPAVFSRPTPDWKSPLLVLGVWLVALVGLANWLSRRESESQTKTS